MDYDILLKQEAKKLYDWFISSKEEAHIRNNLYRIQMSEDNYDMLTNIFELISNGALCRGKKENNDGR